MSSSAQIVTRALRRLKVLGANEDPAAADAADGLAALNAMLAAWQAKGVYVAGDVPLEARFEEGVVALLAVRLADDFSATASASVVRDAEEGWNALTAAFCPVPSAQFDSALTNMPSQHNWVSTALTPLWQRKTAYSVGDQVQWNGRRYECITAGTSGVTFGPMGTGASIADGSVTWEFDSNI